MPDIPLVFDRTTIARHLARRPEGHDDFVTALVLADLEERLALVMRAFTQALILAPDARQMPTRGRSHEGEFRFERVSSVLGGAGVALSDPEDLRLERAGYDLIVSVFDLNVVNDVPGFLARIRAHLRADGLFLGVAMGGDSLTELRQAFLAADAALSGGAFGRVAPFIPLSDGGGLLQRAGLALPVADVETHQVRYQSGLSVMRELKALGASNPLADRPNRPMTRGLLQAAVERYHEMAGDTDGRVHATLELLWLSGWAPDASQQKPLKPGSAEVSLTTILGKKG